MIRTLAGAAGLAVAFAAAPHFALATLARVVVAVDFKANVVSQEQSHRSGVLS